MPDSLLAANEYRRHDHGNAYGTKRNSNKNVGRRIMRFLQLAVLRELKRAAAAAKVVAPSAHALGLARAGTVAVLRLRTPAGTAALIH